MSITGFKIEANLIHNAGMDSLQEYLPGATVMAYAVGARRGSSAATTDTIVIADDALVIAEFDNGIQWCYDKAAFAVAVKEQQAKSLAAAGTLPEIPLTWNSTAAGGMSAMLRLLGVNIISMPGRGRVSSIAALLEEKNTNLLYQCDRQFNLIPFHDTLSRDVSPRYLLLLHGPGSGTRDTFSGLKKEQEGKAYDALYQQYNGNIIAYEHRTFTRHPVQNVIDLLQQMPDNIELDLLSHSGGGLIGEILVRIGTAGEGIAFTAQELRLLQQNPGASGLLADIETLHRLLEKKRLRVRRFVRIACPAAGTTLVSERMDTFLNVLVNIRRNTPVEAADSADKLRALLLAVLQENSAPETLPGIGCLRPGSDLIKVLNFKETQIDSPLIVVAGTAQGEGFVGRMRRFLAGAFYGEDHDLVVDRISMMRGTPRRQAISVYEEQHRDLHHFSYFADAGLPERIGVVFTGNSRMGGTGAGFAQREEACPAAVEGPVSRSGKGIAGSPVLYILPGIMGSHLQDGEDRIWLNYLSMATGGLRRLHIGSPSIKASGINGSAYRDLVDYFAATHYVIPQAYDWRKSIFDAAALLDESVRLSLEQTDQSVCFIAHSMGGLVLRAFAVRYPGTWKALQQRSGFRVLLLGTPNEGSYEIPRVLLGMGRNINLVALLDLTQSKRMLLAQFVQYPGLLNLLPATGDIDFRDEESWRRIGAASAESYSLPDGTGLSSFVAMREPPFSAFQWDPAYVCYIAGKDKLTAVKMEIDTVGRNIDFYGTARGDGSVSWESIPASLKGATFYVAAVHGDLAGYKAAFPAYRELLEAGATRLLPAAAPLPRGEKDQLRLLPRVAPVLLTTEADLSKQIMGMAIPADPPGNRQVRLSITHGDMGHALYPVMAGHFAGDAIVQAEEVLNRKLGGYLSVRLESGNYPGRIGTHEVIFNEEARPGGGIVVGLGDFGSLTENTLYLTYKQALMAYVTQCREREPGLSTTGISSLLVGSGFGGLTVYSCIRAVIMAVQEVNVFFNPALRQGYPFIEHIEFIELYQYKAVQAARIIGNLLGGSNLFSGFVFQPDLIKRVSGSQNRIPDDIQADWWHRLKVYEPEPSHDGGRTRLIRFSSITDKARNEEEILAANIEIVDQLIARAAVYSRTEPGLYKTLYEMLIPSGFKGYGSDLRNIVLIVDKETARYPWEMLHDAYGGSSEPIVTRTGFIRQLSTTTYRRDSELSRGDNALVIGNPLVRYPYPDLPGAALEAAMVAQQLGGYGFGVTSFIGQPGADALVSLYGGSFKVLHIAAHGVVKDKATGQTGVVMGDGLIMTPSDFKQIRYVPELIFINCCSLGKIDKEEEERLQRKYEVAAGVGTQLIEMGAKAVIVAGWEVDDAAAKCFSENLYRVLLEGRPFGEAIRFARKFTYDSFPQVSTWGAYQCYGDPFYTLRSSTGLRRVGPERYYDIVEAINRLETFISKAEAATGRTGRGRREKQKAELEAIIAGIAARPEWKNEPSLLALVAAAYRETDHMEEAIGYYERLLALEVSDYTFRTVEQYCDTRIRYAVETVDELARAAQPLSPDVVDDATAVIGRMIAQLQSLGNLTPGRLSAVASGYKALATLDLRRDDAGFDHLVAAAGYYKQSFEQLHRSKGETDLYPLCNWLQLAAVLDHILPAPGKVAHRSSGLLPLPAEGDRLMLRAEEQAGASTFNDFWHKVSKGMEGLVLLLRSTEDGLIPEYVRSVSESYRNAWKIEGSQKKIRSVIRYLHLLADLLARSNDAIAPVKIKALKEITAALEPPEME